MDERKEFKPLEIKMNLKNYTLATQMYTDDNDDRFIDPQSCYFSQTAPYPVESGLSSPIHLRWCNGDLYLKNHPQYAGPFYPYLQNVKAFICPTFARIATRASQDPLGGKGNCDFLDGHVGAHPRAETFPLAWPH